MAKKKRTHNVRRIKADYSYEIPEICRKLGVHKNTVRGWNRQGLTRIDDRRPHMYHGSTLKEYLNNKQSCRKRKCQPDEMLCLRCKQPRRPKDSNVDVIVNNKKLVNLNGRCEQCGCLMNRRASVAMLPELAKIFHIQQTHNAQLLEENSNPTGGKP